MKPLLWPEGLLLSPQHFQRAEQQQLSLLQHTVSLLSADLWGLIDFEFEIDESFHLHRALLRLPTGEILRVEAPLSIILPSQPYVSIYLSLPQNDGVHGLTGYANSSEFCRWKARYQSCADDYDADRIEEVVFAEPNWQLGYEPPGYAAWSLLIAKVECHQKQWKMQEHFIPPICRVGASSVLLRWIQRLHKTLVNFQNDYIEAELELKSILNGYQSHPYFVFRVLETLHRKLDRVVQGKIEIQYQHQALSDSLIPLFSAVEAQLHRVANLERRPIIFEKSGPFTYRADFSDWSTQKFSLNLAVECKSENWEVAKQYLQWMTVSAPSILPQLRSAALPGIRLIPSRENKTGYLIFQLEPEGRHWTAIVKEQAVMVYLNQELSESKLELQVVNYEN